MSVAAATMGPLKQLVTNELNGTFILQEETSFLSLYDQFIDPITLVRVSAPCSRAMYLNILWTAGWCIWCYFFESYTSFRFSRARTALSAAERDYGW